ncbi:MAG: hypothetical protein GY761_19370 [Hyphomicrobiales bacterium]|nr:hypothetical protein [Hyphomicrobiales bacterium]
MARNSHSQPCKNEAQSCARLIKINESFRSPMVVSGIMSSLFTLMGERRSQVGIAHGHRFFGSALFLFVLLIIILAVPENFARAQTGGDSGNTIDTRLSDCHAYLSTAAQQIDASRFRGLSIIGEPVIDEKQGSCNFRFNGEMKDKNGDWQPVDTLTLHFYIDDIRAQLNQNKGEGTENKVCMEWKTAEWCSDQKNICTATKTYNSCIKWAGDIQTPHCVKRRTYTVCSKRDWICTQPNSRTYCDKWGIPEPAQLPPVAETPEKQPEMRLVWNDEMQKTDNWWDRKRSLSNLEDVIVTPPNGITLELPFDRDGRVIVETPAGTFEIEIPAGMSVNQAIEKLVGNNLIGQFAGGKPASNTKLVPVDQAGEVHDLRLASGQSFRIHAIKPGTPLDNRETMQGRGKITLYNSSTPTGPTVVSYSPYKGSIEAKKGEKASVLRDIVLPTAADTAFDVGETALGAIPVVGVTYFTAKETVKFSNKFDENYTTDPINKRLALANFAVRFSVAKAATDMVVGEIGVGAARLLEKSGIRLTEKVTGGVVTLASEEVREKTVELVVTLLAGQAQLASENTVRLVFDKHTSEPVSLQQLSSEILMEQQIQDAKARDYVLYTQGWDPSTGRELPERENASELKENYYKEVEELRRLLPPEVIKEIDASWAVRGQKTPVSYRNINRKMTKHRRKNQSKKK